MGNPQEGSVQVTQEAHHRTKKKLNRLINAIAKYLPENSIVDRSCIPEDSLVKLSRQTDSSELRSGLAELYRAGYFGSHDVVNGYAWTLAAWNCNDGSYDEKFALAEAQQYYEFFMSADEKSRAKLILNRVLSSDEPSHYVAGNPFNSHWWGWEDDPIPARPGERDFKAGFVQWLQEGAYAESEIADIMARCPPSDGPTRMEKIQHDAEKMMSELDFTTASSAGNGQPGQ
jgi:hypothetical protein